MINAKEIAKKHHDQTVEDRRYIHENAELSFHEENTTAFIRKALDDAGISYKYPVGKNGIVARVKGAKDGKTLAFRADNDALALVEKNDIPYASKNEGVMHACGHDAHTAILMNFARSVKEHEDDLHGEIVFIFQHAEEMPPGGAIEMVADMKKDGSLEEIDAIYALHVNPSDEHPGLGGLAGISHGTNISFHAHIEGIGGHSSRPEGTVDAILLAARCIASLHTIRDRYVNPDRPTTLNVGTVEGGAATNIICQNASFGGMIRAFDPEAAEIMMNQAEKMIKGIVESAGGTCEVEIIKGYPSVYNNAEKVAIIEEAAKNMDVPYITTKAGLGGEDFSYFLEEIPGSTFRLFTRSSEDTSFPLHHPRFNLDEDALAVGLESYWEIYKLENEIK